MIKLVIVMDTLLSESKHLSCYKSQFLENIAAPIFQGKSLLIQIIQNLELEFVFVKLDTRPWVKYS